MHDWKQKIGSSSSPAILARFGTKRQEWIKVEAQPTAIQRLKKELSENIQLKEFQKLAQLAISIPRGSSINNKEKVNVFQKSIPSNLEMNMRDRDLKLAKSRLKDRNLALVIVKEDKIIFETSSQGLGGFVLAIEKLGKRLFESAVADKIVGAAAAMLCAYSEVSSVFAETISEIGIKVLEENDIFYQFENEVPKILNLDKTDICPFEKLAIGSRNPKEAYIRLKALVGSGRNKVA